MQRRPPAASLHADRLQLEDSSPGIRMVNYFKWRQENEYHATCQREEHALWACRAVALQCGQELMQMRECFNELQGVGTDGQPGDVGAILKHKHTAYEKSNNSNNNKKSQATDDIPCRVWQEKVGECIATNSKALARRHIERNAKETDEQ